MGIKGMEIRRNITNSAKTDKKKGSAWREGHLW